VTYSLICALSYLPILNDIWEYVTVTEELKSRAEFNNLSLRAEGMEILGIVLANLIEGAQLPFRNQDSNREKNAKDSAATNQ